MKTIEEARKILSENNISGIKVDAVYEEDGQSIVTLFVEGDKKHIKKINSSLPFIKLASNFSSKGFSVRVTNSSLKREAKKMRQEKKDNRSDSKKIFDEIINLSSKEIIFNNSQYYMAYEALSRFLYEIKRLNVFASKVAESIEGKMRNRSPRVAKISEKQAWVLAFAAVEHNIKIEF